MQALARQGHTADEVRAAITGDTALVTWGVDVLDLDGTVIDDVTDDAIACVVSRQMYASIHGTVDITLTRALDWSAVRVRPWQAVDGIRFDLGVFKLQVPESDATAGTWRVQGYDALTDLQRIIGDSLYFAASSKYLTCMAQVLADSGATAPVLIDSTAADAAMPDPMCWPLNLQAPYSYIRPINDMAAAITYRGIWVDEEGRYRLQRYQAPEERSTEWVFDLSDPRTNIVLPDRTMTRDDWARPTAWRFVRSGLTSPPTEGAGLYTVGDWDADDADRRLYAFDAGDQTSLVSQGDRQVQTDTSKTRLIDITTGPLPCLGHFDVVDYSDPRMGIVTRCQGRAWDQDLVARTCKITLEMLEVADG